MSARSRPHRAAPPLATAASPGAGLAAGLLERRLTAPTAAGVGVAVAALAAASFWRHSIIATDDALIYVRVARHVAAGLGPVVNAGDAHTPATSVLWAHLLALALRLAPRVEPLLVAKALACALVFGASLLFARAARAVAGDLGLLFPITLVTVSLLLATVGLETHLALFGLALVCWAWFARGSPVLAAAAVGAGFFCRGELVLAAGPLLLLHLWQRRRAGEPLRASLAALGPAALALAAVLALGLVLQKWATGAFLPATLSTKVIQGTVGPWPRVAQRFVPWLLESLHLSWWWAPVALLGARALGRLGTLLLGLTLLQVVAYSFLGVAAYPWYGWLLQLAVHAHVVFGLGLAAALAVSAAWSRWPGAPGGQASPARVLATLALAGGAAAAPFLSFGRDPGIPGAPLVARYLTPYREIAELLCGPGAPAPPAGRRHVLLAEEVGLLAYYCPEAEVRDVNGLASPGLTPQNLNDWGFWIARYRPDFLVTRGEGRPELWLHPPGAARPELAYRARRSYPPGGLARLTVYTRESLSSASFLPTVYAPESAPQLDWVPGAWPWLNLPAGATMELPFRPPERQPASLVIFNLFQDGRALEVLAGGQVIGRLEAPPGLPPAWGHALLPLPVTGPAGEGILQVTLRSVGTSPANYARVALLEPVERASVESARSFFWEADGAFALAPAQPAEIPLAARPRPGCHLSVVFRNEPGVTLRLAVGDGAPVVAEGGTGAEPWLELTLPAQEGPLQAAVTGSSPARIRALGWTCAAAAGP